MNQFERPQSTYYYLLLLSLISLQLLYTATSLPWECPSDSTKCLKGDKHKEFASPETDEYAACLDYKESSCCTADFTKQLAQSTVTYIKDGDSIFNWTHCGPLSVECERYFIEIECMYRCDPNLIYFAGDYPSSTNRVPICGQYCDHWYNACKSDLSCVTNWIFDWQYTANGNQCPNTSQCLTFEQRYGDSESLCNVLWGNTFNYTQENELCLTPQYYQVNTLVVEEIFGEQCGLNKDTQSEQDSDDGQALLIVGVIFLVIGILLCIGAIIYGMKLKNKGHSDFGNIRQQSHADTPNADQDTPKAEDREITNQ